jgi:hypothetical protein
MNDIDTKIEEMVEIARIIHEKLPKEYSLKDIFSSFNMKSEPSDLMFPMDLKINK